MILPEIILPRGSLLDNLRGEDARHSHLDGLHDSGGMHDHVVDGVAGSGVTARVIVAVGLGQGDLGKLKSSSLLETC